jgi:hypothetical protein
VEVIWCVRSLLPWVLVTFFSQVMDYVGAFVPLICSLIYRDDSLLAVADAVSASVSLSWLLFCFE